MKINFNKDFWFGAATSGPQSEGTKNKANENVFDNWFNTNKKDFWGEIGPDKACNTFEEYKEDIKLMDEIKLNSFRTSIQWTRLIKNIETFEVDQEAVKFYRDYFLTLKNNNIKTVVNLYHFDLPQTLFEKGGWENKDTSEAFSKYAKICFEQFGDVVDHFTTFNEPVAASENHYLHGHWFPFVKDFNRFIDVANNMMIAHAMSVVEFKKIFKGDNIKKIGIILNLTPSYPKDKSKENIEAAKLRELIFNRFFLDVVTKGEYPKELINFLTKENEMFELSKEDKTILKNGIVDFLGVNYYQPSRVQASTNKSAPQPWNWFEDYIWEDRRINPYRGWEIFPEAIYDIAMTIKNEYKNIPWFIAENGMGVEDEKRYMDKNRKINDTYRIDFYKEHLYWLHKAITEGSSCFGYHTWTFIDCWSWANSFKNRYGFVSLDLKTGKKTIKESGYWMNQVITNGNEIEIQDELLTRISITK
ncbi:glycoside hydrolase family 1 protein [Spiroplasma endosymbiont of Othius punctulatus]|uniref:glycoside hydrolase family 1 protein n=1 Tax=Spiroplasma endosymbiont of Othius punctulatus TaxID=3066289 RepID=UPI0030CAC6CD